MNNNRLIWYEREDFCPNCKKERALIIYDNYGKQLDYPLLLDYNRKDVFEVSEYGRIFSHMKCRFCNQEFFIDWTKELPTPMYNSSYRKFMRNFKLTKVV